MERMTLKNARQGLVVDHDWVAYCQFYSHRNPWAN